MPSARGERRTIVIAGAGIGGLTSALALARSGYAVMIAERAGELGEAGAGIQIAPNAGRVLASLGLDDRIAARAIEPAAIEVRDSTSGKTTATVRGESFRRRYGLPYRVIHRADLQAILVEAVRLDPAIRLELGATITRHHPQQDGLLLRIGKPSSAEVVTVSAVIGADGVWSATREHVAGSARPVPSGRTAWRALIPADIARDIVATDRVGLWLGPDAHLVHYPVAGGAAVNVVAIVAEAWDKPGWSAAGEAADINARFAAWAPSARGLIAAAVSWQKYTLHTVDPLAAWTDGRLALLGDAAHAMVPFLAQGAAMAIEDAAVLAGCLHGATDIASALHAYEALRKTRAIRVAAASEVAGRRYHASGLTARMRDGALRLAGERLILGANDWIYRWQPPR